ncbi:MAG: hypothetical protein B5M51_06715 [Anaerolinea sp. 4484_236]|nr:MAG: hypothetical protein B5M51_06715 [Anaerolinea sp. 4484_236]RLD10669.1 MAG: hypothetical protein DRI56_02240 [Chloroflexota bacterium]
MNKNYLGIAIVALGGVWTLACLFADALGLGTVIFGFSPGSTIGRIQLAFIFVGVLIVFIGVAVLVLIKNGSSENNGFGN